LIKQKLLNFISLVATVSRGCKQSTPTVGIVGQSNIVQHFLKTSVPVSKMISVGIPFTIHQPTQIHHF